MRDLLLWTWGRLGSRPRGDLDLVVEGATTGEMSEAYGNPVGAGFPVWKVGELDLALPRREIKVAAGYRGFRVEVGEVSLADDLGRRDFTVNSLAYLVGEFAELPSPARLEQAALEAINRFSPERVYDPFGGVEDLREGVLRAPYPEAFAEDPVRVLRVARFAARYGWRIDSTTLEAARRGAVELSTEPPERVWGEWEKACAHSPSRFLEALAAAGALRYIRGLEWLSGETPQNNHEENLREHTLLVLQEGENLAAVRDAGVPALTALLFHDRGKVGIVGPHDGEAAARAAAADLKAMKAPGQVVRMATTWLQVHMAFWGTRRPGRLIEMAGGLAKAGVSPALAGALALADSQGKKNPRPRAEAEARVAQQANYLEAALEVMDEIRGDDPRIAALPPTAARGEALLSLRANALAKKLAGR